MLTMRNLIILPLFFFAMFTWSQALEKGGKQQQKQAEKRYTNTENNEGTSKHPPIVITVSPTITANNQPERETDHEKNSSLWEALTGVSTFALAIITASLALFTYWLWRSTGDLVSDGKEASKKELRAYVTVIVGNAIFQEREKNIKFQARPFMVNTGRTPAHDVGFKAKTAIMPTPLPENFDFPTTGNSIGQAVLGSGQSFDFGPPLDDFVDDTEIDTIKKNRGRALYIWGTVFYKDIFEEEHHTDFCQMISWTPDNKIYGYYDQRHNKAT